MPRSRGSDLPQRQSPRGTHLLRTSSSDSDPLHHRLIADRSPKLGNRRSSRGTTQSETVNQKKLGTRIADLESQLGQAQQELKNLKDQLSSAEAEKKKAEAELVKKEKSQEKKSISKNAQECNTKAETKHQDVIIADDNLQETDVFEVSIEKLAIEFRKHEEQLQQETQIALELSEPEKPNVDEMTLKNDEIVLLKLSLEEKKKELESMSNENDNLKNQLNEAVSKVTSLETKEEGMTLKWKQLCEELVESKGNEEKLNEKLKSVKEEKEGLESEMKKLRVQSEQWRKAADAAAAVLAGEMDMSGSMVKHFGGTFETPCGGKYNGYIGSPGLVDDLDDGFVGGKKKGSGIRMFGDLWKKKGQK
ncbi:interactor of constitutive active ROPs 1-like [Cicer arietinum]|uniref:Interactor of constitutive active ROPs 1-like n=1 Tax=Cicer arietinum TaxID=3827 RepID=A0A1S2XFF3_CICAR|nr:interactor of constitutive active ROPs 1-like [Cicer arietinum]XP_004487472.1 interactor of constitutive active ROPs 1-like [Cicer arietinum]XP_004487473.1 interactor of constitutive active ROPs 1-like [Cicer arietinum]XP_027187558.1 interactor of constitutive active ROPs 1-like [Cicer arietinum]XP_027187560.1 interactor of constitutive active ROPs 1-like [Cicer arietinum]